jgi:hypothetical protein
MMFTNATTKIDLFTLIDCRATEHSFVGIQMMFVPSFTTKLFEDEYAELFVDKKSEEFADVGVVDAA